MLAHSELIINPDGSIYHLNLMPTDIAHHIVLVGDPDRVGEVSKHFDHIELKKRKREFCTHTGTIGNVRISAISTGIGTDNIDIVLNELDALVNIDFETRTPRPNRKSLNLIRIGTSGALHAHIPIGSTLASAMAIGLDGLMHFYQYQASPEAAILYHEIADFFHSNDIKLIEPYVAQANTELMESIPTDFRGITLTNLGFYGPQCRQLILEAKYPNLLDTLVLFDSSSGPITNLEMETAGIYGLSHLLGHRALSLNVIIANRALGTFADSPKAYIDQTIETTLEHIIKL